MNGGSGAGHRFCRLMMNIFNLTYNIFVEVIFASVLRGSLLCAISLLKFMQHEYKPITIYADIHYLGLYCVFVLPPSAIYRKTQDDWK